MEAIELEFGIYKISSNIKFQTLKLYARIFNNQNELHYKIFVQAK